MDAPTHKFHRWLYDAWMYEQDWRSRGERNEDYYDGNQWTDDEEEILDNRGQQPVVFNLCRTVIDQILALFLQKKSDIRVLGREPDDDVTADLITQLLKQVYDQNNYSYYDGMIARNGCVVGRGWNQADIEKDSDGKDQVVLHHIPWNEIYCDPFFRKPDASDARYIIRQIWMDYDRVKEKWGEKADNIDVQQLKSQDSLYDGLETTAQSRTSGKMYYDNKTRRIGIYECWYYDSKKKLRYVVFSGNTFLEGGLEDSQNESPLDIDVIPLTPFIAGRNRKGEPQGVLDWIISIQDSLNKLYSKWQWNIMSRQAVVDENAVDDIDALRDEIAKPDGVIVTAPGYMDRFQILKNTEESVHIANMMGFLVQMSQRVSGVNDALLGVGGVNARSGDQESMRMIQGAQMQSQLLDNFMFSKRRFAEIIIKLIGKYYTDERTVRIMQPNGTTDYFKLNVEYQGASGQTVFYNIEDALRYDLVIENLPEFNSVRQYTLKAIVEAAKSGALPVPVASKIIIELADIPGKEKVLRELEAYQQQQAALVAQQQQANGGQ